MEEEESEEKEQKEIEEKKKRNFSLFLGNNSMKSNDTFETTLGECGKVEL